MASTPVTPRPPRTPRPATTGGKMMQTPRSAGISAPRTPRSIFADMPATPANKGDWQRNENVMDFDLPSTNATPLWRRQHANDERHKRWTHRKRLMDSIVGMDPLPVRPEKLAMAGVMITKGTMEEALFSSAGKHGTLGFLENKGAMISKIPAKDKPLPMAEEGQSADKIKEKMLMVRDLDVNEEMENLIGVIMDKRAKGLLKETVWGANKKPEVLLDQVFSTQKMDVAAKEGEEGGVGKEWDQWKEALSNHLRDYKVRMGRKAKIGCSRDELLGQVDELTRENLIEVEGLVRRRRAEMQRADMFDEGVVEERLRLLRKTEMFKKVSVVSIKEQLNHRLTRPAKKSDTAKERSIEEQLLFGALGAKNTAGVYKWSDSFQAPGPSELHEVRKQFAARFDSIYDAWVFLDLDGDWELSHLEFKQGIVKMKIPNLPSTERIIGHLDKENDGSIEPVPFMKALAWHEVPSLRLEYESFLRNSSKRRRAIVENAIKRNIEIRRASEDPQGGRKPSRPKTGRGPHLSARTYDTPNVVSPRYPNFRPLVYTPRKAEVAKEEAAGVEEQTYDMSQLPDEIVLFNRESEELLHRKRLEAVNKNKEFQNDLRRQLAMLSTDCAIRGKLWKLVTPKEKRFLTGWMELEVVITSDGDLVHESEDKHSMPVLLGNFKSVVKFTEFQFDLFPKGVELTFKIKDEETGERHMHFYYFAWGPPRQLAATDCEVDDHWYRWYDVMKNFSWRCELVRDVEAEGQLTAEEQELKYRVEQRMRDQQVKKAGMIIANFMSRRSKQMRDAKEKERKRFEDLQLDLRLGFIKNVGGGAYGGAEEEKGGVLKGVPPQSPRHVWREMHVGKGMGRAMAGLTPRKDIKGL